MRLSIREVNDVLPEQGTLSLRVGFTESVADELFLGLLILIGCELLTPNGCNEHRYEQKANSHIPWAGKSSTQLQPRSKFWRCFRVRPRAIGTVHADGRHWPSSDSAARLG